MDDLFLPWLPLLCRQEHCHGVAAPNVCTTAPRRMGPTAALGCSPRLDLRIVGCVQAPLIFVMPVAVWVHTERDCVQALLIFAMSAAVWVHTERDLAVGGPQVSIRGVARDMDLHVMAPRPMR